MQYRLLYHLQRVDNALKMRKDLNDMHHRLGDDGRSQVKGMLCKHRLCSCLLEKTAAKRTLGSNS